MLNNNRNKMDESNEKMSTGHGKKLLNPFALKKPKKRSLVERELETNMTARITSPVTIGDGVSTSRYGRARRVKPGNETGNIFETLKSPKSENTPVKTQSPITKLAENSVFKTETPKKALETSSDNINTYQDRKSLSRFNSPEVLTKNSSAKKFPKVYIRTDLIQNRDDDDDDVIMIKDLFSPKSGKIQNKALKRSAEKLNISFTKQNGHIDNTSVVKALDFDGNKSKSGSNSNKRKSEGNKKDTANCERESRIKKRYSDGNKKTFDNKKDLSNKINSNVIKKESDISKTDLSSNKTDSGGNNGDLIGNKRDFDGNKKRKENIEIQLVKTELSNESGCPYQVGDLAWARMGTFPFWPCIITKDPESEMFVRKKLFGRVEHYILHVTFFADNGRRSWVVDNMLRKYTGLDDFLSTREKFTAEDKKKDPRLYSAFFISEKKQSLWNTSVEEAETLNREPQDLRIDIFNDILYQSRASKKQKSGRITRTDSDVSLSESLYDSLFSQEDNKKEDGMRLRNKSRNRSLDVSDVVTACLDNMAAKTGNIKIQRQSHMDRWLQKAKSKTPEKVKSKVDPPKIPIITPKVETVTPIKVTPIIEKVVTPKVEVTKEKPVSNNKKKKLPPKEVKITKVYSLRRSYESQNAFCEAENKIDSKVDNKVTSNEEFKSNKNNINITDTSKNGSLCDSNKEKSTDDIDKNLDTKIEEPKDKKNTCNDDSEDILNAINELLDDSSTEEINSLPKPHIALEESKDTEVKLSDHEQDIKPEVMEVDETDGSKVEDKKKPTKTAKVYLDSPVVTDKDSAEKEVVDELECPVIPESSIETKLTIPSDTKAKYAELNIITSDSINSTITSLPLKSNEMVSIPENIDTTNDDDDKSSMTSTEYAADLQDHNSNLTHVSAVKSQVANTMEKEMDTTKADSENLDLRGKEMGTDFTTVTRDETALFQKVGEKFASKTLLEVQEVTVEKPVNVIEGSTSKNEAEKNTFNTENHDMSIDETEDENITRNEKDNESGQLASILQIDDSICDKGNSKKELLLNINERPEENILNKSSEAASILQIDDEVCEKNNTKEELSFNKHDKTEEKFLNKSGQSTSILQIDDEVCEKGNPKEETSFYNDEKTEGNLLNKSGESASISQIDNVAYEKDISLEESSLNDNAKTNPMKETYNNDKLEVNHEKKKSGNVAATISNEPNSFLGNCHSIDVKNTVEGDDFFCKENIKIPPDLTIESKLAKAVLLNVQDDSDYEDSDDEPSPEYEPLGDEITEDFRQHMKCIESNITDKKDEAQLVKVCNEIAILEESKAKLIDIKTSMIKVFNLNSSEYQIKEEQIQSKSYTDNKLKYEIACNDTTNIDLTKSSDDCSKDIKAEILDELNIINKDAENSLKSPLDKKKYNLSLKRNKTHNEIHTLDDTMNPRYKTIDQIEEIMKSKPKRPPIENGEINIPEIKENGYHSRVDTPEQFDDDFDIEEASVNSEDSEVSLPQERIPARRSLRVRPCKKSGLEDPEFLTYMELRQDDLMEEHPELSMDDIVLYLYKTFTYTQNLKSNAEIEESPILLKTVKQETPPSKRKSKKTVQPKNTIENFFREKYKNAKKIDFDSERSEGYGTDSEYKKRLHSISPVDSGIGNSKDSNESDTYMKRHSNKSPQTDLSNDKTKGMKVELINDFEHEESIPRRLRKKTVSPKVLGRKMSVKDLEMEMNKRVPVVIISPIKNERLETTHIHETTPIYNNTINIEIKNESNEEPIVITIPELDTIIKHEEDEPKPNLKTNDTNNESKDVPNVETINKVVEVIHKPDVKTIYVQDPETIQKKEIKIDIDTRQERDNDTESMDSDSELPLRQLRSKVLQENKLNELKSEILEVKDEIEETASVSSDNEPLLRLRPKKVDKSLEGSYEDPEFLKYVELKQDNLIEDNPDLTQNEIKAYLYKTWIYEKDSKTDIQKNDDIASSNLVKGLNQEKEAAPTRRKRKPKTEKFTDSEEIILKDKPKRKTVSHYYNEAFISDIEDELEVFEIFKTKKTPITVVSKSDSPKKEAAETKTEEPVQTEMEDVCEEINTLDEIELYFKQLTSPKPSVFKGLIREKVCEICEDISNLIKCKGCNGTFHFECVKKTMKTAETPTTSKGRKRKKKLSRKLKNDDSDHSDERDISEENISFEETIQESITIDAETIEAQIEAKMKEILDKESQVSYDSYSSDEGIDWSESIPGKCELIDVKLKRRTPPIDYTNFKCNNCQKHSTPVCFVCKLAVSKTDVKIRQKCNVAHCHSYYHLQCLDHWPQTQFNAGEWSKNSKKAEQLEALTCPRHVCHTCVSDDPRGCKTRFSGDKLAKCVRCPATYHSFNKCLPAGTQILTASLIICPRHYEHRPGKVPCHVNTGWCFICALGGSLICCEYCPTSFHAECLNIKPPEGNYMCEDCETGRLPLYGEMVWVKLGHYRWWPGIVLHPSEIPDNIMAVKHGLGEFVVRFFGQYDHYWVNRGRVFPYQEGDSGRISSQKSKIDVAFTTAMEHAQRAFEILKNAQPDEEESLDIASSLLPPHYVKLKCNKPIGSLLGRKIEDPSLSLTQCECNPAEAEPCGPNSQCINRMLLTECGPTCRAGDRCSNRAFEKRLYPKLTPYRATHRGWGLKTLEDIKAGQFVIEYVGELIDEEEFQRRMRRQHEIRDENFYFLTLDKERMIDAGPKGNLARFMNHCCEPNCETQKWTVLGDVRVGLFAIDDIKANSEVTFNYNLECTGIEKKRCLCGAKRCSGYIGAKPKQLDESQRKKNGLTKRKYTKRKNLEESPSTSSIKNKVKKPVGRPPKTKELTEIEKDLLIIKNATVSSDESVCQSAEEKTLKNSKTYFNTINEASNLSEIAKKLDSKDVCETESIAKIDSSSKEVILNGTDVKTLKRKLDLNTIVLVNEPSAKKLKFDKQIEVGD